jgi:hypothetical protein
MIAAVTSKIDSKNETLPYENDLKNESTPYENDKKAQEDCLAKRDSF